MDFRKGGGRVFLYSIFLCIAFSVSTSAGELQDGEGLKLYDPTNIRLVAERTVTLPTNFKVYITFDDVPDSLGTYIHAPDLSGWSWITPESLLSVPSVVDHHSYTGSIDRTIEFRVLNGGEVNVDTSIVIQYAIRGEENFQNTINIGQPHYSAGENLPILFRNSLTGDTLDLGIELRFSEGIVDSNGVFLLGCEDFEGFHIWRGIVDDEGNLFDVQIIGEISKEEAFDSLFCDSLYFDGMLPALRQYGRYVFTPGMTCFNNAKDTEIELQLDEDDFFWVDYTTFNGFTYAYYVSTFDRGYNMAGGSQGLEKFDSFIHCESDSTVSELPCPELFKTITIEVPSQENLLKVYAVPNPYRSGTSVFTTPNYHNYPDNMLRFVNVPPDCKLAIYTTAGDLVWETEHRGASGNVTWDTRNGSGEEVASGIYVYKIQDSKGGVMYGRLVIIR